MYDADSVGVDSIVGVVIMSDVGCDISVVVTDVVVLLLVLMVLYWLLGLPL